MNDTFLTNWKSQIKKGTLSFIIMNILKENEYYGYELIEKIRKHTVTKNVSNASNCDFIVVLL